MEIRYRKHLSEGFIKTSADITNTWNHLLFMIECTSHGVCVCMEYEIQQNIYKFKIASYMIVSGLWFLTSTVLLVWDTRRAYGIIVCHSYSHEPSFYVTNILINQGEHMASYSGVPKQERVTLVFIQHGVMWPHWGTLGSHTEQKTQDRGAQWMWSGTCAGGWVCQRRRCRRTECLLASPGTLLLCWSGRKGQLCQSSYYCDSQSNSCPVS